MSGRTFRMRNAELRVVLMLVSGAMSCVVYGPVGLAFPLMLAVLWLAELGAFHD